MAISTPAGTHVTLTERALRLGLAVVCDKPFAPDADSARQVVRLSEQLNVPLTVHQNRRWDSDFPDRARAPGQRIARRADRLGVAVRAVPAGARPARGRRRHPAGLRQPPGRPGPGAGRPGDRRVRRGASSRRPRRARRRRVRRPDPRPRRTVAPVGQLAARRPGPRFRATGTSATYVIQDVDGQEAQLRGGASPSSKGEQRGVEPPERWGHLRRGEPAEPVASMRRPAFSATRREAMLPTSQRHSMSSVPKVSASPHGWSAAP